MFFPFHPRFRSFKITPNNGSNSDHPLILEILFRQIKSSPLSVSSRQHGKKYRCDSPNAPGARIGLRVTSPDCSLNKQVGDCTPLLGSSQCCCLLIQLLTSPVMPFLHSVRRGQNAMVASCQGGQSPGIAYAWSSGTKIETSTCKGSCQLLGAYSSKLTDSLMVKGAGLRFLTCP